MSEEAGDLGRAEPAGADGDAGTATTQLAGRVSDARSKLATLSSERPEVVIGAAFAGGLVIAIILKRLAR